MLLAMLVCGEAGGEPYAGQVAVAQVVENRVRSEWFPNTFEQVIWQPWQFSAGNDGTLYHYGEPTESCHRAAYEVYYHDGYDGTFGSLFYHAVWMAEYPPWGMVEKTRIGAHIFY